jgi:calcium-dependent protein kinase
LNKDIDFKILRDAFFTFDKKNVGMLTVNELKEALRESTLSKEQLDKIFNQIDFDRDGVINYSEFLAATVDKHEALTMQNL